MPSDREGAAHAGIVVAPDAHRAGGPHALDDRVRLGAVADDVAQVPDRVDRAQRSHDGVEGGQVRVDVRQHGNAHYGPQLAGRRLAAGSRG